MAVKETIAFIGIKTQSQDIMAKLAQQNFPLIFIMGENAENNRLTEEFQKKNIRSEIEFLKCPKNGCWEADIIVFAAPENFEMNLLEKIRKVATQKIVVFISELKHEKAAFSAEQLKEVVAALPNSKVVPVLLNSETSKAYISGNEREAVDKVSFIFEGLGYETGNKENED